MCLLLLHLLGNLHDEVGVITLVIVGSYEVIEPNESNRQSLGLGVLQTLHDDLHDGNKVLLQSSPRLRILANAS